MNAAGFATWKITIGNDATSFPISSVLSNSQKVSLKSLEELKRGKRSYCT